MCRYQDKRGHGKAGGQEIALIAERADERRHEQERERRGGRTGGAGTLCPGENVHGTGCDESRQREEQGETAVGKRKCRDARNQRDPTIVQRIDGERLKQSDSSKPDEVSTAPDDIEKICE